MSVLLCQIQDRGREIAAQIDGDTIYSDPSARSSFQIISEAIEAGKSLGPLLTETLSRRAGQTSSVTFGLPIRHPEPHRCWVSGTGLTHIDSATTRDNMHSELAAKKESELSDSMKMFRIGLEGGRPGAGEIGAQPEWFYKGNGLSLVNPGDELSVPPNSLDGGDEAELAGIYYIRSDRRVVRIGFAIGNEFSDHAMERINYLYLAHSKLRPGSFGPAIRIGEAPAEARGKGRIIRKGRVIWSKEFASGNNHMCHTIANLEHHHFKYPMFRNPGDLHVHYMGAASLSFTDGIRTETGDRIEIEFDHFGPPLVNTVVYQEDRDKAETIAQG